MIVNWIRVGVYGALAAAIVATGLLLRAQFINEGEAKVQAKWNAKNLADAQLAAKLQEQARANDNLNRLNAERTADEAHRRDQARAARLADAQRTAAGLRDAIAKLDADDLSEAVADPRVAAVARRAIAARRLLGQCQQRYGEVAARAASHRDQAAGLRDFALTVCHAGAAP